MHALRKLGESSMDMFTDRSLYIPIPYIFNIPYKPFQALSNYFNISDCLQWYMYEFEPTSNASTRAFFGQNTGLNHLESHGLINGHHNILSYPCREYNKTVPFFEELERDKYASVNEYLTGVINLLHD